VLICHIHITVGILSKLIRIPFLVARKFESKLQLISEIPIDGLGFSGAILIWLNLIGP
jgi:hypothetical protein